MKYREINGELVPSTFLTQQQAVEKYPFLSAPMLKNILYKDINNFRKKVVRKFGRRILLDEEALLDYIKNSPSDKTYFSYARTRKISFKEKFKRLMCEYEINKNECFSIIIYILKHIERNNEKEFLIIKKKLKDFLNMKNN